MKPSPTSAAEVTANSARWHDAFIEAVRPMKGDPLMLSGGVDSATILAALLELGVRPKCYTYALSDRPSADADSAWSMAREYGLDLTQLVIDASPEAVERDAREAISLLQVTSRVAVQCGVVCLAIMRHARRDGATAVIGGLAGVVWDTRDIAVMVGAGATREEVDAVRRDGLYKIKPGGGTDVFYRAAAEAAVAFLDPYQLEPLASTGLSISYEEINWPRPKAIAQRAFPKFYDRGWYRRPTPMQVVGGVRALHDEVILKSPTRNPTGALAVAAVYRRWATESEGLWTPSAFEGDDE